MAAPTAYAQSTETMMLSDLTSQTVLRSAGLVAALAGLVLLLPLSATGQNQSVESLIEQGQQAGADGELMRTVANRAQRAGLSADQTADLLAPVVTLAQRDLPTSPFLSKTLEGVAKQVPPARLTSVLQNLQNSTEQAGTVVSTWLNRSDVQQLVGDKQPPERARNQLVTSITEAEQQNLPVSNVEQFLDNLPGAVERRPVSLPEISVAVSVLPDLPGSKNNAQVAHELLSAALEAGYDAESMRQLPAALSSARQETQQPAAAIARGAAQAITQGTPAANVLKNLFQGNLPGGGPPADVGGGPPETPPGQGKPPGQGGTPPGTNPGNNPGGNPGGGPPDDPPRGPPS